MSETTEFDIRGELAAALKCWHRLTGEEAAELVAFVAALKAPLLHNVGAARRATRAAQRQPSVACPSRATCYPKPCWSGPMLTERLGATGTRNVEMRTAT